VPLADVWRHWDGRTDLQSVEAELLRRLDDRRDPRVDAAVSRIVATGGTARVDHLAREIGISRQHLARLFLQHVGTPPKMFARVMRFRGLIDELSIRGQLDWAGTAAKHGYYDQAHLTADFRELAGTTPNAFHFSNR
jgi:methylphosphotriester-DNA--protein-cysteine methyltransferase